MRLYKLAATVLRISGDIEGLLDGITSNSLEKVQNAFLDRFGKIVAVVWQVRDGDDMLLVVMQEHVQALYAYMKPYITLRDVSVKSAGMHVYVDCDQTLQQGTRIPLVAGQLVLTKEALDTSLTDEAFLQFRVENKMPFPALDYGNEMALNVGEDFVSFTKGCFVGQEVVARVKNLGKPPKKLVVEQGEFVFVRNV